MTTIHDDPVRFLKFKEKKLKCLFSEPKSVSCEKYSEPHIKKCMKNLNVDMAEKKWNGQDFPTPEDIAEVNSDDWEKEANPPSPPISPRAKKKSMPYINLLHRNKTDRDLIVWNSKYLSKMPNIFVDLPKSEQTKHYINTISIEFAKYWKSLGTDVDPTLKNINTKAVMDLFTLSFNEHVCKAIQIDIKEIKSISKQIAKANCQNELSIQHAIEREIKKDLTAERAPLSSTAFGTHKPKDMLSVSQNNNVFENWVNLKDVPQSLVDTSAVWGGITHLRSTKMFYQWLRKRPARSIPQFLFNHFEDVDLSKKKIQR